MPERFAQVTKNLFRGGEPSAEDLLILKNIWGINKIVSLDNYIGKKIHPLTKDLNIKHIIIPLGDGNSPNLKIIKNRILFTLEQDGPTYIHCKHGKDRTGMCVAMFRIFCGMNLQNALEEAENFGMGQALPPKVAKTYYNAVVKFDKEFNKDKNDADIVEESRSSKYPAINDTSITNFGRTSFSPFEDPTSSRFSRSAKITNLLEKLYSEEKIYCRCLPNQLMNSKRFWYTNKKDVPNNQGNLYSAIIGKNSIVENYKKPTTTLIQYLLSAEIDAAKFDDGKVMIFQPNILINIMEEDDVSNDDSPSGYLPDIGIRDNYQGLSNMIYPSNGGFSNEGFAGPVIMPFSSGINF